MIPYGKHHIDQQDIDAVVDVLSNQFITQGKQVPAFENALCNYTGADFAVAVNSGTSGLHIACLSVGLGSGDILWTSPISFVASANCALYCGAEVDFVDIDPLTRNICPEHLSVKLAQAVKKNRLPKALVVVHFTGVSCDMLPIRQLAQKYRIVLIEDAAHALGANYAGNKVGCCQYSDMTVMSFHPVKSITTAEGGAVLTNDAKIAANLRQFASHGVTRNQELMQSKPEGPWYYEQLQLGYNYRLSDLHAALGISQLAKISDLVASRQSIACNYLTAFSHLPVKLPQMSNVEDSAWHIFVIELIEHDRLVVFNRLRQLDIGVNVHYFPIHLQPYYQNLGFRAGDFPNAEAFYKKAITLPLFPFMSADEQHRVVQALIEVLN